MRVAQITSLLIGAGLLLSACSEEPVRVEGQSILPSVAISSQSMVAIHPATPTAGDCLRVVSLGQPGRASARWEVNDQQVVANQSGELCNAFRRGDKVKVEVGEASASVVIGNSLPLVTGISATPLQVHAGIDLEVFPVGEDRDGDPVEFRYQWLLNGETDPFLTERKLVGNRFHRGDRVQVIITPFDGRDAGPAYQGYVMLIPNAPPQIVSVPSQKFEALEYSYHVIASDPDGDPLSFSLAKAPPGMAISISGQVTWPLSGVLPGSYPIKIVASDPDGAEAFQEFTLTLDSPSPAAKSQTL